MVSDRKLLANRRNALKSTGPRTPHGKAVSAKNSLKHGLLSREVIIPGENIHALTELRNRLHVELEASGELEARLVDRITGVLWRLGRCSRIEADLFALEVLSRAARGAREQAKAFVRSLFTVDTPEVSNWDEHKSAVKRAEEAHALRATAALGAAFAASVPDDAFGKLSRYEVSLERSLFRNLHELQRLQAARRGHRVPPLAVDVEVSGSVEGA